MVILITYSEFKCLQNNPNVSSYVMGIWYVTCISLTLDPEFECTTNENYNICIPTHVMCVCVFGFVLSDVCSTANEKSKLLKLTRFGTICDTYPAYVFECMWHMHDKRNESVLRLTKRWCRLWVCMELNVIWIIIPSHSC